MILLALIALVSTAASCPSSSELAPCYCEYVPMSTYHVTCPGVMNAQTVIEAVYALRNEQNHFFRFTIRDSVFMYIPHDAFKGIRFQELEIIDSTFMSLSDTDVAFEGLGMSMVSLVIKNSTVLNYWDWSLLQKMKILVRVHVDVDMGIVTNDINKIGSASTLKDLSLADNQISFLEDTVFTDFCELTSLSLRNNRIRELKRSMFPYPANRLWHLDLSNNEIEQFPPDLFDAMRSLTSLLVASNKLLTISEHPFERVWSQLKNFNALGNQLRCDCRLQWMTKQSFPISLDAVCAFPQQLEGKKLNELTSFDLWCLAVDDQSK